MILARTYSSGYFFCSAAKNGSILYSSAQQSSGDNLWSAIFPTRPAFLCGAVRVRVRGSEGEKLRSGFWNQALQVVIHRPNI